MSKAGLNPGAILASGDDGIDLACKEIRDACRGKGRSGEKGLVRSLGSTTPQRRMEISSRFRELYGEDLPRAVIKSKYSGDFGTALRLLVLPTAVMEAKIVKTATASDRIAYEHLYPILCGRSNEEIQILKQTCLKTYGRELEKVLSIQLTGDFLKMMLACLEEGEEQWDLSDHTDAKARSEVDEIALALQKDQFHLMRVICSYHPHHLKSVSETYESMIGRSLSEELNGQLSGVALAAAIFALNMKINRHQTVARLINGACSSESVDLTLLTTSIIRFQPWMDNISLAHKNLYGKSLRQHVHSMTSGKYRDLMLGLIDAAMMTKSLYSDPGETVQKSTIMSIGQSFLRRPRVEIEPNAQSRLSVSSGSADHVDSICFDIHQTCKRGGKDVEKRLIKILGSADHNKRAQISLRYEELFDQELASTIQANTSGKSGEALQLLAMSIEKAEARLVHSALAGSSVVEDQFYPILCGRSMSEIEKLKRAYVLAYGKDLWDVLAPNLNSDMVGFVSIFVNSEEEEFDPDFHTDKKAESDAEELYFATSAGNVDENEVEENSVMKILHCSPPKHLNAVVSTFESKFNCSLQEALDTAAFLAEKDAALLVLGFKLKPHETIAWLIKSACEATDDTLLAACIIRYQPVMRYVMLAHEELFGMSIKERIESHTSGNYRVLLLGLIETASVPKNPRAQKVKKQAADASRPAIGSDASALSLKTIRAADSGSEIDGLCKDIKESLKQRAKRTNEKKLIKLLGSTPQEMRAGLSARFRELYGHDMTSLIKKECSGDLGVALQLLSLPTNFAEASLVKMATSGFGRSEKQLFSILCGKSNEEINALKHAYSDQYGKDLVDVLTSQLSGDFLDFLLTCIRGTVDKAESRRQPKFGAKSDAEEIFIACLDSKAAGNKLVFDILCNSTPEYLQSVNDAFAENHDRTLYETLNEWFSGPAKEAALFTLGLKLKPHVAIAQLIKSACAGIRTDSLLLSSCLIRYQPLMREVVISHKNLFGKDIADRIESKTSGNYKALLLQLLDSAGPSLLEGQAQFFQTLRVNIPPKTKPGQKLAICTNEDSAQTSLVTVPKKAEWLWDSEAVGGVAFFITTITGSITPVAI